MDMRDNPIDREIDEALRDYRLDCQTVCWFARAAAFALLIACVAVAITGCGGGVEPACEEAPPALTLPTSGDLGPIYDSPQPPVKYKPEPIAQCDPRGR